MSYTCAISCFSFEKIMCVEYILHTVEISFERLILINVLARVKKLIKINAREREILSHHDIISS